MRILQIIPCVPGWYLNTDAMKGLPVMCWALVEDPAMPGETMVLPVADHNCIAIGEALPPGDGDVLLGPDDSYDYTLVMPNVFGKYLLQGWTPVSVSQSSDVEGTEDITILMKRVKLQR